MKTVGQQRAVDDEARGQLEPCHVLSAGPVTVLEADGVGGDRDKAALSQLGCIGLVGATTEAADLTLAEVELPGMLMVAENDGNRLIDVIGDAHEGGCSPARDVVSDLSADIPVADHLVLHLSLERPRSTHWS